MFAHSCVKVFHLEDIVEETGYVLDQDSEYSQRFVEEEEEISVSVTQKGGRAVQYQVRTHKHTLSLKAGLYLTYF